eukprot:gene13116-13245_t
MPAQPNQLAAQRLHMILSSVCFDSCDSSSANGSNRLSYFTLRTFLRIAACSKSCQQLASAAVQNEFLSLLPSAVKAAASQQQFRAAGSLQWLINAAGPQALSSEALAAALVTIPDVPAAVAAQVLAAGLPVTERQLVAAAKAKVSGLDVWLQHEPCLELLARVAKLQPVLVAAQTGNRKVVQELCTFPAADIEAEDMQQLLLVAEGCKMASEIPLLLRLGQWEVADSKQGSYSGSRTIRRYKPCAVAWPVLRALLSSPNSDIAALQAVISELGTDGMDSRQLTHLVTQIEQLPDEQHRKLLLSISNLVRSLPGGK